MPHCADIKQATISMLDATTYSGSDLKVFMYAPDPSSCTRHDLVQGGIDARYDRVYLDKTGTSFAPSMPKPDIADLTRLESFTEANIVVGAVTLLFVLITMLASFIGRRPRVSSRRFEELQDGDVEIVTTRPATGGLRRRA
jgi:hypothetical protein